MLKRKEEMAEMEKTLEESGMLAKFCKKNGRIVCRMLVESGTVPDNFDRPAKKGYFPFVCSSDYCDVEAGALYSPKKKDIDGGIWLLPQKEEAYEPPQSYVDFFFNVLIAYADSSLNHGMPLYIFIGANGETLVAGPSDSIKNGKLS